ncbi:hypothetical protein [Pseudoalteromonas sp. S16_S37]|uniref:hypothetical protein n=1 Tax=Pseudoalteromonas sp. S16_S37 TaxID=2720228 RepID=UPI001680913B|nr:hypothetical protein [Pseudoalteromonas sp. S16_S37]MBD1583329.1 hypothetical protein [Pseudoalteromonas sp. S16_S37]
MQSQRMLEHNLFDLRGKNYWALYEKCLHHLLDGQKLEDMNANKLHDLYKTLKKIFFYAPQRAQLIPKLEELTFRALAIRKLDKKPISDLYKSYLFVRNFEGARKLRLEYPDLYLPQVPKVNTKKRQKRDLLKLIDKGSLLTQKSFSFKDSGLVIMIGSPFCQPSKKFVTWLLKHDELKSVFINNSYWLMPQNGNLYIEKVAKENQALDGVEYLYIYDQADWPEIKYWGTPSFYFYTKGQLVGSIQGFDEFNFEAKFKSMLSKIDLI